MATHSHLGVMDIIVIVVSLLISAAIGIKFRLSGNRQRTTAEYLLAGKDMSKLPVILSISVTMVSAITIIGYPSEIYKYGVYCLFWCVSYLVGTIASGYIFIPTYFKCNVTTVYEFLEIRFGKRTRYVVSALFLIQMIFYMSIVLYSPALALSAVTNLSIEMSVTVIGVVCTFYCVIGGLKAVLWTDVFQAMLIFIFLIILYVQSIIEGGGIGEIFKKNAAGQRLILYNFSVDPTVRYTTWNLFFRGFVAGIAYYGTSQVEVQRMLSMRSSARAVSSLVWGGIVTFILSVACGTAGLIMYAIFQACDPVKDKAHTGIRKYDEIIPYYIVTRFNSIPGLTGLCVAGIFSGSLSTISSALNSLSTVTVVDFVRPLFRSKQLSERTMVLSAKCFSLFYGAICIALAFTLSKADSILAAGNLLLSIMEGPMLAIFIIGVMTRKGSEMCTLIGLIVGTIVIGWLGYGILFSGYRYPSLPLSTSGCSSNSSTVGTYLNTSLTCLGNSTCLSTRAPVLPVPSEPFILYKMSFMWISTLGTCFTLLVVLIAILLTGCKDVIPPDSKCLSPITRLWNKNLPPNKENNGLETDDILLQKKTPFALPGTSEISGIQSQRN